MNASSGIGQFISLSAPILFFVLGLGFLSWLHSLSSKRRTLDARLGRMLSIVGILILAFVAYATEKARGQFSGTGSSPTISRVIEAADSSEIDRIQVLAAVVGADASAFPQVLIERIVPVDRTVGAFRADFLDLGMSLELKGDLLQSNRVARNVLIGRFGNHEYRLDHGLDAAPFAVDDARPFHSDARVLDRAIPFRLRDLPKGGVILFWRELRSGDRIEAVPTAEFTPALERALASFSRSANDPTELAKPRASMGRLIGEASGLPCFLLIFAFLLILVRVPVGASLPLAILLTFAVLAIDWRRDLSSALDRLDSPDADTRRAAISLLGEARVFAPSAARALAARFEHEPDPRLRAEIVRATVDVSEYVGALPQSKEIFERAKADPAPEVKLAVKSVGGLRERRGP